MSEYREARTARKAARAGAKENHGSAAGEAAQAYRQAVGHDQRRGVYYLWVSGGGVVLFFLYLLLRDGLDHWIGAASVAYARWHADGLASIHLALLACCSFLLPFWIAYCRTRMMFWPRLARERAWRYLLRVGYRPEQMAVTARARMPRAPSAPWRFTLALLKMTVTRPAEAIVSAAGAASVSFLVTFVAAAKLGAVALVAAPFLLVSTYLFLGLRTWMPVPPREKSESGARSQDQLAAALRNQEGGGDE